MSIILLSRFIERYLYEKKVMFFLEHLEGGGAEKVAVDVLNKIDKKKYNITLVLLFGMGVNIKNLDQEINVKTIVKKPFGRIGNKIVFNFMKYMPELFYKLFMPKESHIEVAFLEGFATKIISYSTNKESKKIAWVHTDLSQNRWTTYAYKRNEEISCYRKFDDVVFVSKDAYLGFDKVFNVDNINKHIVYNPIIIENIITKSKEREISYNEFTIVSVGRLVNIKGFDRLIKAHAKLVGRFPHSLVIIGEGEERRNLEQLVNTLGVNGSVDIMGFIENPYPYIKAANLFVSASKTEGYGVAVAEAILLEKPVMITNITGTLEILGDKENGVVCENSQEGIEKGLEYILQNKNLLQYYEKKSRERRSFFQYNTRINEIEEIFDK